MIKNILLALSLTLFIAGCHNHFLPLPYSIIDCLITSSTKNGATDFNATYNNINKVDSLADYSGSNTSSFKLKYDANNNVIVSSLFLNGGSAGFWNFHYNINKLRDADTLYLNNPSGPPEFIADSVILYTYNSSSQIIRVDNYNINDSAHAFSTYTYNSEGNLITYTSGLKTLTFTYDSKRSSQNLILNFLSPVYSNQIHNVLTQTQTGDSTSNKLNSYTATYSYTPKGYPIIETRDYLDNTDLKPHVQSITYSYDCRTL